MRRYGRLAIAVLALALGGCAASRPAPPQPPPTVTLAPAGTADVTILANAGWQSTGVLAEPGDTYEIRARGEWSMGALCGTADADGTGNNGLLCPSLTSLVSGTSVAALIGRVGERGRPFLVGTRRRLTVEDEGLLYLAPNSRVTFDNVGAQSVAIARSGAPVAAAPRATDFPTEPVAVTFRRAVPRPEDVAVIIGNADYRRHGRDIPDVTPAYADAEGFRRFVTEARGVRPGNVIHVRDATGARLEGIFGDESDHRGQLFDWVRPGKSRVYVYYAGHGAPAGADGGTYLVPADADAARLHISGYPLATLYGNLGRLPAVSVTVVLEACFSGVSQAGPVVPRASGVYVKPRVAAIPPNLTVISAGAADQIASWEPDGRRSLFTSHFLMAMAGAADASPYGDGDGTVAWDELERYLRDTLTYLARRHYGRDQTAAIVVGRDG